MRPLELGEALERTEVRVAGKRPAVAGPRLAARFEAKEAKPRGRERAPDLRNRETALVDVEHEVPATAHGVEVGAPEETAQLRFVAVHDVPPKPADPFRRAVPAGRFRDRARRREELPRVFAV